MIVRTFDEVWSQLRREQLVPLVSVVTCDQVYRLCSSAFDLGRKAGHLEADAGLQVDGSPRAAACEPADQLFGGGS